MLCTLKEFLESEAGESKEDFKGFLTVSGTEEIDIRLKNSSKVIISLLIKRFYDNDGCLVEECPEGLFIKKNGHFEYLVAIKTEGDFVHISSIHNYEG